MKKINLLGGALLFCLLVMNASPHRSGGLAQYSGKLLGEVRVKDGLTKTGRCPQLCTFISVSETDIVENEFY
ncbi:MAG: hypothetical protein V4660_04220 [Pseudomonadota bacterium]